MPTSCKPDLPIFSLDPIVNAIKNCRAAEPCLAAWLSYWQGKTTLRPAQNLSYHLNPEDSRLFGSLKRVRKSALKEGARGVDLRFFVPLCNELRALTESLRQVFKKKCLSKYAEDDLEVLDAVNEKCLRLASVLKSHTSFADLATALSDYISICNALHTVILRRESIVDGREPDEIYPRVELGRYAKGFIKFADQNVGLVVFKDINIGAFYINRAAKSAWGYLRPLLAASSKDGWVVIEANVRQGFGRTTSGNDSDIKSDVVRLDRHIHSRQRGHTSNHEWKISPEEYQKTEHIE